MKMKTTLIILLTLICFSATSQIRTIELINPEEIAVIIEEEIEFALKEIENIELDFEDFYFDFDDADVTIEYSNKWYNKHQIDKIAKKDMIKIELLELMEEMEKNEDILIEKYNETIERWNETKFAEENLHLDPLK